MPRFVTPATRATTATLAPLATLATLATFATLATLGTLATLAIAGAVLATAPGVPTQTADRSGRTAVLHATASGAHAGSSAGSLTADRYRVPLAGHTRLLTPFERPATTYSAGHRGVDLAAEPGTAVLAAGAGVVSFAGNVAGRTVVVVRHPDGLTTEYEPVTARVQAGRQVRPGEPLGEVHGLHERCGVSSCLHWGAKRGDSYLDPMSLLAQLGVVRLVQ